MVLDGEQKQRQNIMNTCACYVAQCATTLPICITGETNRYLPFECEEGIVKAMKGVFLIKSDLTQCAALHEVLGT
jgi:hypothetical protein